MSELAHITASELATALEGFWLEVVDKAGITVHGQIADADVFADALHATLGRMAALREPCHSDPHIPHQACPGVPAPAPGGPGYYQGEGGMQPFDVIDAFGLDFYEGNVVKYIVRWRKKGGLEDLYKARRYVDEVIKRAQADQIVEAEIWCDMHDCVNGAPGVHPWSDTCRSPEEASVP